MTTSSIQDQQSIRRPRPALVAVSLIVSSVGVVLHNVLSLPDLPITSPESLLPIVIAAVLFAAYARFGDDIIVRALLVAWAALNLVVGAVLTVLPLPLLPFEPEQTVGHYLAHAAYFVLQVPLLVVAVRGLRSGSAATGESR